MGLKIACAFRCWASGYDLNCWAASILWSSLISNRITHMNYCPRWMPLHCHVKTDTTQYIEPHQQLSLPSKPTTSNNCLLFFFPAVPMFYIWISALRFLWQVGQHYIVDATSEEESQMSSAVSVSVNRNGQVCGLTKRGGAGLDPSVIFDMISVAKHVSQQFIAHLDSKISAAEAAAEWRGEK